VWLVLLGTKFLASLDIYLKADVQTPPFKIYKSHSGESLQVSVIAQFGVCVCQSCELPRKLEDHKKTEKDHKTQE
jgi:hypothetical protein